MKNKEEHADLCRNQNPATHMSEHALHNQLKRQVDKETLQNMVQKPPKNENL